MTRSEPSRPEEPVVGSADDGAATVDVGLLVVDANREAAASLRSFAARAAEDVAAELDRSTAVPWRFWLVEPEPIHGAGERFRPSEFLDDATNRMVEGPYDLVVVFTDVPIVSRRERVVPGLASPLGRVAVVSTAGLGRDQRARGGDSATDLDAAPMRWNGGALVLHLIGHAVGLGHERERGVGQGGDGSGSAMAPFRFDPSRRRIPTFAGDVRARLERLASDLPQTEAPRGRLRRAAFHLRCVARNPREFAAAVASSRGPLLPLSLPKLATAGVAPALILVFSAETWDVGITLTNRTALLFAVVSLLAAAVHVLFVQNLLFPRRSGPVVTEHVALVNAAVAVIVLLVMLGLFLLIGTIVLFVELAVFPPNLMTNWPSLEDPVVTMADLVRTAAFIATVGTLSGALGGALEDRAVVRHLALFLDRP